MENELSMPLVHLSGKEIPGIAARVFGTALMPWGATGGAAQAIEFAELAGMGRLRALAGQLDSFDTAMWRAPEIVVERDVYALCDACGGSALFYAAALADWLDAWVGQQGDVIVGIRNVAHVDDLHAVSYWLARRGHAALVLTSAARDEVMGGTGSAVLSAATSRHDTDWIHATWTCTEAMPSALLSFASTLAYEIPSDRAWQALREISASWLDDDRHVETGGHFNAQRDCGASAIVVAMKSPVSMDFARRSPAGSLDADRFAALQAKAAADSWPIPRTKWEQLMRFADRSLIHTSERSREGAG